jgi:polyhydroxybutyrate depolymerase
MVAAIGHAIGVNGHRAYAAGVSNGGILAYDLACHTTTCAATGPGSAT